MGTVKEAREALAALEKRGDDDSERQLAFLEGVGAFCKEAGIDPDVVLDTLGEDFFKEGKYKVRDPKVLAASIGRKNMVKKNTPGAPQLDCGAAVAAKALKC